MTTAARFAATLLLACLGTSPALGQVAVAPDPHPSLDELAKEYQRLGLPVPPKDAVLIRVNWEQMVGRPYSLAFRYPPAHLGGSARYLFSLSGWPPRKVINQRWDEIVVKPVPESLAGVGGWREDWFPFAAQCKLRGWDDLARAVYAEGRNSLVPGSTVGWRPGCAIGCFHLAAWRYWQGQLTERHSNRRLVLTRLRRLVKEESTQGSRPIEELEKPNILLEDLELTLLPRKSKPGSVEALIDGLTDYWEDPEDSDNEEGQTAYWKLAERGLEAVPVLVEHRRDYRLTRTKATHPKAFVKCDVMRVNQLVEDLLNKLSGERFDAEEYWTRLEDYKPPKDHKWWAEARKMGEERWLLTIVLPPPRMVGEESFEPHTPNEIALRVIRAKYPNRLAEVYRKLMKDRPMISSEMVAKEIVASNLPRDRKLGLLEEGATNKDFSHRLHALEALATVDGPLFRKLLLKSIQNIPSEITFKQDAYNPEILVAELIRKTDDRDCWNALAELTRAASPSTRHHLINSAGWPAEPGEADPGRRQCIKFLQLFLNDCEIGDMPWQGPQAVRDHATKRLAHLLGLAELDYVKNLRSPREISILRDVVREAADREVVRPRK